MSQAFHQLAQEVGAFQEDWKATLAHLKQQMESNEAQRREELTRKIESCDENLKEYVDIIKIYVLAAD